MEKNYTLYISVTAKGGNNIIIGPYELRIGCHKDIPILFDSTYVEYIKTIPVKKKTREMLSFEVKEFKSANQYCQIENYDLIYSKDKPELLKLERPFP